MAILNTASIKSTIPTTDGGNVEVQTASNTHRTNYVNNDIIITKSASKQWVIPQDKITVQTTITNNTDVDIENIYLKTTLGEGAQFVAGSVKVGSTPYTDFDAVAGFTMPVTLGGLGNDVIVSYDIEVDKYLNVEKIVDNSTIRINLDNKDFDLSSQNLEIDVVNNEVYVLKQADTTAVKTGDTITYTITITNNGTLKNTNITFTDPIPENVEFVEGSMKVDGIAQQDYNPATGFALKNLDANDSTTIEFKVIVK